MKKRTKQILSTLHGIDRINKRWPIMVGSNLTILGDRLIDKTTARDDAIENTSRIIPVSMSPANIKIMVSYILEHKDDMTIKEISEVIQYALVHKINCETVNIRDLKIQDTI